MKLFHSIFKRIFFYRSSFALKKLKFKMSSEEKNILLDSAEFREAKLLLRIATPSDYIAYFEDYFFDELNHFYIVTEYFEVSSF